VQGKYDTWRLPCCFSRDRIASGSSFALLYLSSADCAYGGDALAIFLDCGDSRAPPTAEFRADLFLLVSFASLPFRWVSAGTECAVVLHRGSRASCDFLLECGVPGIVALALPASAPTSRVCTDPRTHSPRDSEAIVVGAGLFASCLACSEALRRASAT
jgi:hypothetical protein